MPGVSSGFLDFDERQAERREEARRAALVQSGLVDAAMRQQDAAMRRQAAQRALTAREGAGAMLLNLPQQGGIPMPGMAGAPAGGLPPPPGMAPPAPAAPAPGAMSPGGGNPALRPAPMSAPAQPPQAAAPAPAPVGPPPPPPPFRPMPTSPPPEAAAGGPGGIAMPAAPQAPAAPPKIPPVADLVRRMKDAGVPPGQVLDQLEQITPLIQMQQTAELNQYKAELSAQNAAIKAYQAQIQAYQGEERLRQGEERLRQGREKVAAFKAKMAKMAKDGGGAASLDDETARYMAEQALGADRSVFMNLGRGKQGAENVLKIRRFVREIGTSRNISGQDLATITAEFEGLKAGERALGTRTATLGMAKSEAYKMADLVTQASATVPRTQFPKANEALNAYRTQTGDVNIRKFGASINSFINAYARAIAPVGSPAQAEKEHAREMLNTADTPEAVIGIIDQLKKEMEAAGQAPGEVRGELRKLPGAGGSSRRKAPAEAEAYLKEHPELAKDFSAMYGYLPAGIR
jgi:hypothetical protein